MTSGAGEAAGGSGGAEDGGGGVGGAGNGEGYCAGAGVMKVDDNGAYITLISRFEEPIPGMSLFLLCQTLL